MSEPMVDKIIQVKDRAFIKGVVVVLGLSLFLLLGYFMGKGKLPLIESATPAATFAGPIWKMTADHCAIYNIADPEIEEP